MIPRKWRWLLQGCAPFAQHCARANTAGVTKFVLLSLQRSGSTWVMDLLDSHPYVRTYSELFQSDVYGKPRMGRNRDILVWNSFAASDGIRKGKLAKWRQYFRYLDEVIYRPSDDYRAVGFKLMYNQAVSAFAIPAYLLWRRVCIVHLVRRNYLDAILSEDARHHRGIAHAEVDAKVAQVQFELDPLSVIRRLEHRESLVNEFCTFFSNLRIPYIEITYEELRDQPGHISAVIEALGLPMGDAKLSSTLQKLNPTAHPAILSNYETVKRTLEGTRYASLLREA